MPRFARLGERLDEIEREGLRRQLRPLFPTGPTTAELAGAEVDVFSSNDYLGLARRLRSAWRGCGTGSSRLIAGDRNAHHALEEKLEALFCAPALVFPSGYHANLAVMTTLFESGDRVASDALNHASIIDGLRLSSAKVEVVEHGAASPDGVRGHVVEGLYSMDGDQLELRKLVGSPWLVVDEAHAVGCLGPGGRGASFEQNVVPDVLIGTFGKAYGAAGAFVIGPPELKRLLTSKGRSFIYTTGLAEPAARAALMGMELATDALREQLAENVRRFRSGLHQLGGRVPPGKDHIVGVVLGDRTMQAADTLLDQHIFVPGIRYPTVPRGQERLRFSLSAAHTPEQIDRCLEVLGRCL
ncbi:MAG: 8-amino-7-oxononanoate synthase [Proteobacteria bacterium]|nr:8-amino-7-oxononanoate synthase [Pseudomonadota bacterium]MCP4919675.1 8-amino-7-oxononanoate synthase [Pseudomonadota bacterium]